VLWLRHLNNQTLLLANFVLPFIALAYHMSAVALILKLLCDDILWVWCSVAATCVAIYIYIYIYKSNGIPSQAKVALGVPGRLRPRIFSTFGTTRVVVRQPNTPAASTPGEIPGTHFQRLSLPQGTWFCRKEPRKNPKWHHRGSIPGPSD
jgi:hypothetical protein